MTASLPELAAQIREDLVSQSSERNRKSFGRFFKEPVACHGVKTPLVGKIAKSFWKTVRELDKDQIFALCQELYLSDFCEEAFVVSFWLPNLMDLLTPGDLPLFKSWLEKYLNNWAKIDGFCVQTLGGLLEKYPEQVIPELFSWAKSTHLWLKRGSAVSFIAPAKRGKFLPEIFKIADLLLEDPDDLVQKGYGWMLKEASRQHRDEVLEFVLMRKNRMPRTALRYAIELMPPELKAKAMKRD